MIWLNDYQSKQHWVLPARCTLQSVKASKTGLTSMSLWVTGRLGELCSWDWGFFPFISSMTLSFYGLRQSTVFPHGCIWQTYLKSGTVSLFVSTTSILWSAWLKMLLKWASSAARPTTRNENRVGKQAEKLIKCHPKLSLPEQVLYLYSIYELQLAWPSSLDRMFIATHSQSRASIRDTRSQSFEKITNKKSQTTFKTERKDFSKKSKAWKLHWTPMQRKPQVHTDHQNCWKGRGKMQSSWGFPVMVVVVF